MMLQLLQKVIVYGCLGVTIEVMFTGTHAIIFDRDLRAPGRTYIWMIPIYGFGGVSLGWIRQLLPEPWLFIPVAVLYIYVAEFTTGWLLKRAIGRCPWDYGQARFGIMGLIRLDYFPFWLLVAIAFDRLADYVSQALELAGRMAT